MILKNSLAYLDDAERRELHGLLTGMANIYDTCRAQMAIQKDSAAHAFATSQEMVEALDKELTSGPPTRARIEKVHQQMLDVGEERVALYQASAAQCLYPYEYVRALSVIQGKLRSFMDRTERRYGKDTLSYADHFQRRKPENRPFEKSYDAIQAFLGEDLTRELERRNPLLTLVNHQIEGIQQQYRIMAEQLGDMAAYPTDKLQPHFDASMKKVHALEDDLAIRLEREIDSTLYMVSDYHQRYGNFFRHALQQGQERPPAR